MEDSDELPLLDSSVSHEWLLLLSSLPEPMVDILASALNHTVYSAMRGGTQHVTSSINPAHLRYVGVVCVFNCPQLRKYLANVSKKFFAVSTGHYLPHNTKNKETKK